MGKFRLNVFVSYHKSINSKMSGHLIHSIFTNLACLYKLDFYIEVNTPVFDDDSSDLYATTDLIYFRSGQSTPIDRKTFQKLIDQVFAYNNILIDGIEVYYQYQKYLREFPFPKDFYRPLNYPYIEEHKDSQVKAVIPAAVLLEVLPELYNS